MSAPNERRLGLVALGDSITLGEGSMALGVTPLSWAQWLAKALDLPFTTYAVNGAFAGSRPSSSATSTRCSAR